MRTHDCVSRILSSMLKATTVITSHLFESQSAECCYCGIFHRKFVFHFIYIHSLSLIVCSAVWLCQVIYYWKCPAPTYFMHILLQLISSKAAVFFISDENSGWLPISLLLIISFSFDLWLLCQTHSFIHLFCLVRWTSWILHRLMHIKTGFRSRLQSCESEHMAVAFWVWV